MRIRVILVEPEHEGNIGSIARLMKNFDLNELWIVNQKTPIAGEAVALASHAKDVLDSAIRVDTLNKALKDVSLVAGTTSITPKRTANILRTAITPEEFARIVSQAKGKVAILLGRESLGLSNLELDACDLVVSIPTSQHYRALNVASAAGILFYELWKNQHGFRRIHVEECSRETRLRLVELFERLCEEALIVSYKRKLAVRAFLNILSRAPTSTREASLLMGVFRQTLQRLEGEF
ncbi:MAG: RNA methyltransferase [Candidatus Bathyarchaeia archaeon]